jgi:hypothetical protein
MNKYVVVLQNNLRQSSSTFMLFAFKLVVGVIFGLTVSLIGEEIFGYGRFLFFFVIVAFTTVFLAIARRWRYVGVGIFILLFILGGMVVRMYGLMAPVQ